MPIAVRWPGDHPVACRACPAGHSGTTCSAHWALPGGRSTAMTKPATAASRNPDEVARPARRRGSVYRGDAGMWSWVAHRITGVLTFFFLFAHVLDTALVRVSPEAYNEIIETYKNPLRQPDGGRAGRRGALPRAQRHPDHAGRLLGQGRAGTSGRCCGSCWASGSCVMIPGSYFMMERPCLDLFGRRRHDRRVRPARHPRHRGAAGARAAGSPAGAATSRCTRGCSCGCPGSCWWSWCSATC